MTMALTFTGELEQRLESVFEPRQATVLAQVITQAYDTLVKASDFVELKAIVRDLATAQQRTEQRLEELAAAQQRTEQRVEELAAAQQRTEQRVEELAAAQQRTEQRLQELAMHVGRLSDRIGASVEDEAADVLRVIMERKGYRALRSGYNLALDGEVDVVLPLQDAQGQSVWAVLEAKVRLGWRAVEAWANRMRDPHFQAALRAAGVAGPYLVYTYGIRIDESAREAAAKFGIGLLSSRGEEVPPNSSPNA